MYTLHIHTYKTELLSASSFLCVLSGMLVMLALYITVTYNENRIGSLRFSTFLFNMM